MDDKGAFSAQETARTVLEQATTASLATLLPDGTPYASLVTIARDGEGCPLLLISRLAVHTRNLEVDPRASLLLVAPGGEGGDPLAGARLTLSGRIEPVARSEDLAAAFLKVHPAADLYLGFADFGFYRATVARAHLVAGFGRIVDLTAADLGLPPA